MLREILGIIAGYAFFVATSLMLFKISGHEPHEEAVTTFLIITIVYGVVASFLSGIIVKLVAASRKLWPNYILALIIAGFALFSLLKSEAVIGRSCSQSSSLLQCQFSEVYIIAKNSAKENIIPAF